MTNRPEKGDKAPIVTIPISDEETVNLGLPTGKAHVVYFYPRDNTPGCTTEAIDFTALKTDFEALGVQIIGASKDSLKSHANFQSNNSASGSRKTCTEKSIWESSEAPS